MEDLLLLVTTNPGLDLIKGKGNRDGLIQQIVTYVRDGRTVTRKQWVRSEFADHAKKNEEEKKKTLLEEQEREDRRRAREIAENNLKAKHADARQRKKLKNAAEKETHPKGRAHKITDKQLEEYKRKLKEKAKKAREEEKKRKEAQAKKDSTKRRKEEAHSRFGQSDQTRADNKAEQKLILNN